MKKQKRILKTIILIMLIVLLTPMTSFATNETEETTVTVYTGTNTDVYNLGENVQVSVSWWSKQGNTGSWGNVQAIGFTLQYDESKLECVGGEVEESTGEGITKTIPLEEDYYNSETPGTVVVSMVSFNDRDIYGININFKTKAIGQANIKLTNIDCMSNGSLISPNKIDFTTNSLATIKTIAFGDVDLNGTVDNGDATILMQYLENSRELTEQQLENADVNLDKIVDDMDVILIRKYCVDRISLPIRYGDVNLDGKVATPKDRVRLAKYLDGTFNVKLTEQELINADTNMDGLVNEIDLNMIGMYRTGWDFEIPFKMIKNTNVKAIDRTGLHIVTGFHSKNIKVSELLENFNTDKGFEVCNSKDEILENDAIIGTGTKIKIGGNGRVQGSYPDGSERYWLAEFNVVIYGDTTGDGKINAIDALAVIKDINNKIPFTNEIYRTAGKVYSDVEDELSAIDALAIIKYTNGKYEINQSK